MEERLQKILARAGLGSRRACEKLIAAGRVSVNKHVASLGMKADTKRDRIKVDGHSISSEPIKYIALYKPPGVLSTVKSPDHRSTVRDLVKIPGRLYPIGRLDVNSEGLTLLTNDGELTHLLTHPRYQHLKKYHVCVTGHPSEKTLRTWRRGIVLDGYRTAPAQVSILRDEAKNSWLEVGLREGRKRQIRRVAANLGHPVQKLIRVSIGPIHLGNLKPGQWRNLTKSELKLLRKLKKQ